MTPGPTYAVGHHLSDAVAVTEACDKLDMMHMMFKFRPFLYTNNTV